jgi:hypothetical protein
MSTEPRNLFQFHLITALAVMIALGIFTPLAIGAFRISWLEGAAMTYLFILPTLLGAFELEGYISAQAGQSVRRRLQNRLGHPLVFFALTLVLIFLWALCLARIVYPLFT